MRDATRDRVVQLGNRTRCGGWAASWEGRWRPRRGRDKKAWGGVGRGYLDWERLAMRGTSRRWLRM